MNTNRKIIISCIVAICAVGITVFLYVRGNSEKNKTTEILTVPVLGKDYFGLSLLIWILSKSYQPGTVKEEHDIRILLNGSGILKVTEHRLAVASHSTHQVSVQLRKCYDRDVQLLGSSLEGIGNLRHLLHF